MRFLAALLVLLVGVAACDACTPAASPNQAADTQARALARGTVETLETVWMTAAKMCMAVAESEQSQQIADDCKNYLTPARESIVASADAVDVWDAAAQSNFPCLIAAAIDGVDQGLAVATQAGLTLPQVVKDGQVLANLYAPKCVKDGGSR